MAFGAKVQLSVNKTGASKFRSEIQQFVNQATSGNPIKIKNIEFKLNKGDQAKLRQTIQSYLKTSGNDLTIKVNNIDASGAIGKLRSQLETMLSGLSITGLKDFMGAEGAASTYEKAADAANKLAEAQANVKKKTDAANSSAQVLKSLQTATNKTYQSGNKITDSAAVQEITSKYSALCAEIQRASSLEGSEQQEVISSIAQKRAELQKYIDTLLESQSASAKAAKEEQKNNAETEASYKRINSVYKKIQAYAKANPKVMRSPLGGQINDLLNTFNSGEKITNSGLAGIEETLARISVRAREAGLEGKTLGDVISAAYQKFGGWMLVTRSLSKLIQAFKKMISVVVELDTAMTELKKVTDLSPTAYDAVFKDAVSRAKSLGTTVADTITATADFSRLGYGIGDATELADAAIIYKNVGDGIDDITTASESIISTMKAFGDETLSAMDIVDKFNEVGNNFAISSKGVGDALQRSSAALAAAGNTLDESIGLAVGMNTVIQDPEKVGTVLKTASMYLRAAKTDAEAAGEATDGMANSISELRAEILTLTKNKVDIMADETTFKSTTQIYRELADVWDELADVDAANILELIGGKRNATANAALLSNFDEVEDAIKAAAGASGSAIEENAKQLESIEGRLSVFKATFQELSSTMFPTETIKGFIDAGNTMLGILNSLITTLGGFGNTLAVVGNIIALLNFQKTAAALKIFSNSLKTCFGIIPKITSLFGDLKTAWEMGKASGGGFISTLKGAASALIGTSSAAQIATASIMAIVAVISIAIMAYQSYQRKLEEQRQAALEAGNAAVEETQKITEAYNAYTQANDAYKEHTGSKEELTSATTALLSALGIEESQINNLITQYGNLDNAIKSITKETLSTNLQEMTSGYEAAKEELLAKTKDGWFSSFSMLNFSHGDNGKKFADTLKDAGLISSSSYGSGGGAIYLGDNSSVEGVIDMYQKLIDMRAKLEEGVQNDKYTREELSESDLYKEINNKINSFSAEYESVQNYIKDINEAAAHLQYLNLSETMGVPKTQQEFEKLKQSMIDTAKASGNFVGTEEQIESAVLSIMSQMPELSAFATDIANQLNNIDGQTISVGVDIETEKSDMGNFINSVKESVSSTGLTDESITNITKRFKDLESFNPETLFEKTANGIHLNADALRDLESEYEAAQKSKIDKSLEDQVKRYNELTEKIKACSDAQERENLISQRETLATQIEQTATLAAQYDGLTSAYQKWVDAQSMGEEGDMYDSMFDGLKNMKELYQKGLVGTNEFRAAAQLMTNFDISDWSIEDVMKAYENGYPLMTRYFTEGQEGCQKFLSDVSKLNSEWAHMNEDGTWEINFGEGSDQDIADKLGISVDAVQAILRKLSDYGFEIDLDSIYSDIELAEDEILDANEKLKQLGKTEFDFNFNSISIEELTSQIGIAEKILDEFKNEDGTINLSAEGADEAIVVLKALIARKQELEAPAVMKVDTSDVTTASSDAEQAVLLLQQFVNGTNDLEIQTAIGADTTEAQANVDSLVTQIQDIDAAILASLGIDTTSVETIIAGIQSLTPQMIVEAGVDPAIVAEYIATEKTGEATMIWHNDTTEVDDYIDKPKTTTGTVYWTNKETNSAPSGNTSGDVGARGTAFAKGTAFKSGDWGTRSSGVALGGELGQELVVRDGRFFTIGDESAEFFKYKKDDIIFNAEQTKQIFEKGKITTGNRRGKALADGTAFAEGTAFSTGSGRFFKNGKLQKTVSSTSTYKADVKVDSSSLEESMEEALKEMKEAIDDIVNDYEHQIFIMEKHNAPIGEIIEVYKKLQESVHDQAEQYRQKGLDDNSEYIQEMQKQWWEYHDAIIDLTVDAYESTREQIENSVDLLTIDLGRATVSGDYNSASEYVSQILSKYKEAQDLVHEEAEYYRSLGYEDTSNEVSELSKLWQEYHENAVELIKETYETARAATENDISLNQIWLNGAITKHDYSSVQKHSNAIVSMFKDMQNSVHEEAEYFRSLGYSETSDEVAGLSELWAEYQEEMITAISEAYQALVDSSTEALDEVQSLFSNLKDAAQEYAQTGSLSVDVLQSIMELGPEYMSYLRDEDGQLVINKHRIEKLIEARTKQLTVDTALNYVEQLRVALMSDNTKELDRLLGMTESVTSATWGLVYANLSLLNLTDEQYDKAFDNINKMRSLSEQTINGIDLDLGDSSLFDDTKGALDTILDLTMDLIKYEADQKVEALEDQIDRYKDIIDLKKESLDASRKENDYNKEVSERVSKMADLQERINQLSLDDSREAQVERKALEEELAEMQTDLTDYQSDYSYDKMTEMFDKEVEEYEEAKNKEIEAVKDSVSSTEKVYQLAIDRINNNWDTLFDDIIKWNYEAGSTIESEIVTAWDLACGAVEKYGSYLKAVNNMESISLGESDVVSDSHDYDDLDAKDIISKMRANSLAWHISDPSTQLQLNRENESYAAQLSSIYGEKIYSKNGAWYHSNGSLLYSIPTEEIVANIVSAMKANSSQWANASDSQKSSLANDNERLATYVRNLTGKNVTRDNDGIWWIGDKKLYDIYHKGGIVGGNGDIKSNEVLSLLEKGELVLDDRKKDSLYKYMDISTYIMEKFGAVVDNIGTATRSNIGSMLNSISELSNRTTGSIKDIIQKDINCTVEIAEINAPVQVLQKLDEGAIREHAKTIGSISAKYIQDGFTKRGIYPTTTLL